MNDLDRKTVRQFWYWLVLLPLIGGASEAFIKYAGWAAFYSGNLGLPSESWRLKEAESKATLYWWLTAALALPAIVVAFRIIPSFRSQDLPPGIKGIIRFVLAVVLVLALISVVVIGVSAAGDYFPAFLRAA
jgi:hypothetical protein